VIKELTCIVCPIGCSLEVTEGGSQDNLSVNGNRCQRGVTYALEEIRAPKRVVTATCLSTLSVRRIPVKTSAPCPREKIPALLQDIYKVKVTLPVKAGDVLIANWNGEEIDIIATRTVD